MNPSAGMAHSSGLYGICPVVVKPPSGAVAQSVCSSFQTTAKRGKTLRNCKAPPVVIYKGEQRPLPESRRPMSLTCVRCKCSWKLIGKCLRRQLTKQGLLQKACHSTLKSGPCLSSLLNYMEVAAAQLNKQQVAKMWYVNLGKISGSIDRRLFA